MIDLDAIEAFCKATLAANYIDKDAAARGYRTRACRFARTDVPALIARVRELEEEREQVRARLEEECERTRGLEHALANHGRIQMTQPTNKSTTFQTNAFTRAPMTLVDYGLSMWVCAVCDKCAVFNRQAGKPNGWRTDRCPECQGADE
jgi:hypothetical protein